MKKISKPIVFFGSGPVAAKSLASLMQDFEIEAVITKPRPAHHKGDVPVLELCEKANLPIFTAEDRKTLDELFSAKKFVSDLAVLVDFGIIVSQKVIDSFPLGIINSHFSLLPAWRGADPITFSILHGDQETGVSLMLLVEAMDEGPLLAQATYPLRADITTPELTEELIELSSKMLSEIIPLYLKGQAHPMPQDPSRLASYSRRLSKQDGIIEWSKSAVVLEREIRAFAGWPKSRATVGGMEAIVTKAHVINKTGTPGRTAVIDGQPVVYCGEKALLLESIKPANKKQMSGTAFLAGYKKMFLNTQE